MMIRYGPGASASAEAKKARSVAMASALAGLSKRQHAAEEAWAREAQELAAAAHRARLDTMGAAGAERLARAAPAAGSSSMLPSIAAQYLRLSTPKQARGSMRAARPARRDATRCTSSCGRRPGAPLTRRHAACARACRRSGASSRWRTGFASPTARCRVRGGLFARAAVVSPRAR